MNKYKISKYTPSIFQGRLELRSAVSKETRVLSFEMPFEQLAFRVLFIAIGICAFGYLYFVAASVLNVIARKEASTQAIVHQSAIGELEREYFALHEGVTPESAQMLGLSPIERTAYVYRPGNSASAAGVRQDGI